jgi:hypothetical protein
VEVPDKPASARRAALNKAGFTRLMPPGATFYVCPTCRTQLADLALQITSLLGGQEVPLWQLIPESKRGELKNEDLRRGKRA